MRFRFRTALTVVLILIVLGGMASVYAGQVVYAGLWHMLHGASARCGAFSIPVPANWWAQDDGCALVTSSPPYGFGDKRAVQIFFNVMATPSVHDSQWQAAVLKRLELEGHPPHRVTDLTVAGRETICFEHDGRPSTTALTISCNVDQEMEINVFYDNPKWIPKLYEILRGIRS